MKGQALLPIINIISYSISGWFCADAGLDYKTPTFWILLACMAVNGLTSYLHGALQSEKYQ